MRERINTDALWVAIHKYVVICGGTPADFRAARGAAGEVNACLADLLWAAKLGELDGLEVDRTDPQKTTPDQGQVGRAPKGDE